MLVLGPGPNTVHNVVADNNSNTGVQLFSGGGTLASNITTYNNPGGGIYHGVYAAVLNNSIILDGIVKQDPGHPDLILSNNITSGSAASLFVDAANGNFTSTVEDVGANLSSLGY
jgi:hypothetical protein